MGSIELGHVWFGAGLARSTAATEAIFLLCAHAFHALGYRRLEWKCDSLNAASMRAAERFGFGFEGVFRHHQVIKGRNRDSAWYAITSQGWPAVRDGFERWLAADNFDAAGRQRVRLEECRDGGLSGGVVEPRLGVELMARDASWLGTLARCGAIGAEDHGLVRQRDTYFGGALMLREQTPGAPELIRYERAEESLPSLCRYQIAAVEDVGALSTVLAAELGVRAVVVKRRRLLAWRGVRIHLDEVDGLGTFVELEVVVSPECGVERGHALIADLRDALLIREDRVCACGYAALLERACAG